MLRKTIADASLTLPNGEIVLTLSEQSGWSHFDAEQRQGFAEIQQQLAKFEVTMERRFIEIHRDIARIEVRLAHQLMGAIAVFVGVVIILNAVTN